MKRQQNEKIQYFILVNNNNRNGNGNGNDESINNATTKNVDTIEKCFGNASQNKKTDNQQKSY